jgi:hypothetical protein
MKIELKAIVNGMEFQTDESQVFFNKTSGEILMITDEEMQLAKSKEDISGYAQWMQDAVKIASTYLEEQDNYLELPTKYEFHEYSVMEDFIVDLSNDEQRDELYQQIKARGAFSNFKRGLARFSLEDEWYEYRENAQLKLAKQWCDYNGIEVG